MIYEVWVEFYSDDKYVENQHVGTFTTKNKANEAIDQAWKRINEEQIEDVINVVMYQKELNKNYWT